LNFYLRFTKQQESGGGLFIYDPWPEEPSTDTGLLPPTTINGAYLSKEDPLYLFWSSTEGYMQNRRIYDVRNLTGLLTYDVPVGEDVLKTKIEGNAASQYMKIEKFSYDNGKEYNPMNDVGLDGNSAIKNLEETGERRAGLQITYLLNRVKNLQLAAGYYFRFDDIGKSNRGNNSYEESRFKKPISNVQYTSHAIFAEEMYTIRNLLGIHLGGRLDKHTRTDFIFSPKMALILTPDNNHSFKLIYQTSSNNGTADTYEYNQYNTDEQGNPYSEWHFEWPDVKPDPSSGIIPPVTEENCIVQNRKRQNRLN
jgi:hypothetical protein